MSLSSVSLMFFRDVVSAMKVGKPRSIHLIKKIFLILEITKSRDTYLDLCSRTGRGYPRGTACWPPCTHTPLRTTHSSDHTCDLDPLPTDHERGSFPESHRAARPTPISPPPPTPTPSSGSSSIITDTGICLRTIWRASLCKRSPHGGSPWPDWISRPHVGPLLFLKTAHSATAGELISFQQGLQPCFQSTHPSRR